MKRWRAFDRQILDAMRLSLLADLKGWGAVLDLDSGKVVADLDGAYAKLSRQIKKLLTSAAAR